MKRLVALADVVAYRHPEVVARFCDAWDVAPPEARRIFADLMRYLWLTHVPGAGEIGPVRIVDEMWHTFLVYTIDYRAFSQRYFGAMVEHQPTLARDKRAFARLQRRSPQRAKREVAAEVERDAALVIDHLGARVAHRWYIE
jgi:hypothetical protein